MNPGKQPAHPAATAACASFRESKLLSGSCAIAAQSLLNAMPSEYLRRKCFGLKSQHISQVVDTNVFVTALRSQFGASYKLLSLLENDLYKLDLSVPLVLEYEEVAKRMIGEISLSEREIDDILDFVISRSNRWHIF
jgi:hypothetical protein